MQQVTLLVSNYSRFIYFKNGCSNNLSRQCRNKCFKYRYNITTFSDNGSNFTTATLTALPDFATGIKMAKVNDLSVTAGTQLKYKILFANQSASKEARIRGVSLNY